MKRFGPLFLFLMLASCASMEYREEYQSCRATWLSKLPEDPKQRLVTYWETIRRPTGKSTCTQQGGKMHCIEEMYTSRVPYQVLETYDANKPERDAEIRACAVKLCTSKYGNAECRKAK